MEEVPSWDLPSTNTHSGEAGVRWSWTRPIVHGEHQDDQRVNGKHPEDQKSREVDEVLEGVHGNTCPRRGVRIPVVKGMNPPVHRHPMYESMICPEVGRGHEHHTQSGHKEHHDRVGCPSGPCHQATCVGPVSKCLVNREEGHPTGHRPEGVVSNLAAESELRTGVRPPRVELKIVALRAPNIQPPV